MFVHVSERGSFFHKSIADLKKQVGFSGKFLKLEELAKFHEETDYFEKKTLPSVKKAPLLKWEGTKCSGGSRPSGC